MKSKKSSSRKTKASVGALKSVSYAILQSAVALDDFLDDVRTQGIGAGMKGLMRLTRFETEAWAASFAPDVLFESLNITETTRKKFSPQVPWPQPSPHRFGSLPATVLNVPDGEIREFLDKVVSRYIGTLRLHWINAAKKSLSKAELDAVSDDELSRLFTLTPFSRFLNPKLDKHDLKTFKNILKKDSKYFKVDFTAVSKMPTFQDIHLAPTVTLFERVNAETIVPRAIAVNDLVLEPRNSEDSERVNAWDLSKLFVTQGAAVSLVLGIHPTVHFPVDAINALTKALLPEDHILHRLLKPHLYLQLPLNYAVLYLDKSVAHNNQREIYTPFAGPFEGVVNLIEAYYKGIPDNSSYPAYEYPLTPPKIHSQYGEFLQGYFDVILKFVYKVTAKVTANDEHVTRWADEISKLVPGFPNGEAIWENDFLARAVTSFIWDVSVVHTSDHYSYAKESVYKVPLRIRHAPPSSAEMRPVSRRKLIKKEDLFRFFMAHEMYFKSSPVRCLVDVQYEFENKDLASAAKDFIRDLSAYDRNLKVFRFIPLKDIATSIQY